MELDYKVYKKDLILSAVAIIANPQPNYIISAWKYIFSVYYIDFLSLYRLKRKQYRRFLHKKIPSRSFSMFYAMFAYLFV